MNNQTNRYDHTTKTLRWIARISGTLIVLFWLIVAFAYGTGEPSELGAEDIMMAILVVGTTIGVLLAWKLERIGGVITLLFGIAHSIFAIFASGHNHAFAMLISGGPFIVIGILFLIVSARSTRFKISQDSL
jgi:succinate dehydrogenase hydrophobic anchor subunit